MKNFFKAFFGMFRSKRSAQASADDIARKCSQGLYAQSLGRAVRCPTSSRMCDGTKSCGVEHKSAMKYTQMDDGRWQAKAAKDWAPYK